ncbi:MAG: glycosyl hydrolase family 28 protein [Kiritimatiellae bacterium]|nr:glycosyl hydrolase family 28 protein [Kiritimatiellia bacterium]
MPIKICLSFSFLLLAASLVAAPAERVIDAPSSTTNATALIQRAIDETSATGGGRVVLPKGEYVVCALELKSNVELHLAEGAALLSVTNLADYTACRRMNSAVFAIGATNITISGKGTIDGRGEFFDRVISRKPGLRLRGGWRTLTLERCHSVKVEDITLKGATSWTFFLKHCDVVQVRRIRLFGHANYCNDGIDIDSKNVLIENCDIDAEDDAIVFKTHRPDFAVENVEVRNCRLASNSSNIKFGTESLGTFRNVRVHHCTIGCKTPSHTIAPHNFPGEERGVRTHAISGIEVSAVDGGSIEDVVISDITMGEGIDTPIFVRLAHRKEPAPGRSTYLRNVTLERITMTAPACAAIANAIAGVPGLRPQNIMLRDLDLIMLGGGTAKEAAEVYADERERAFPMPYALFRSMLPAYGFYVRHADGVRLENVRLRYADGKEARPAVVTDDADVSLVNCDLMKPVGGEAVIHRAIP